MIIWQAEGISLQYDPDQGYTLEVEDGESWAVLDQQELAALRDAINAELASVGPDCCVEEGII